MLELSQKSEVGDQGWDRTRCKNKKTAHPYWNLSNLAG